MCVAASFSPLLLASSTAQQSNQLKSASSSSANYSSEWTPIAEILLRAGLPPILAQRTGEDQQQAITAYLAHPDDKPHVKRPIAAGLLILSQQALPENDRLSPRTMNKAVKALAAFTAKTEAEETKFLAQHGLTEESVIKAVTDKLNAGLDALEASKAK